MSRDEGHGTAIVPFNSLALQGLIMPRWMSFVLFGVGVFLLALLISIVGAATRESILPAGSEPTPARRRLAAAAMAVTCVVAVGVLFLGQRWWTQVDRNFRYNRLYQVKAIAPILQRQTNGQVQLSLNLPPTVYRRSDTTPLVPDHGQLMHLFLIRKPGGDAFAHLHPLRETEQDGKTFLTQVPPLPAGDYDLYADITHESGFTETLTNVLHLADPPAADKAPTAFTSPDDSIDLTSPQPLAATNLPGGFHLNPAVAMPFRANEETTLRFEVTTDAGAPAPLEPYLGMYGHLMIQNADGTVFAHLHPLGSISMASQKGFAEREHATYLANQPLDLLCAPASPTLAFPYAFPKPGRYRLWLQTKLGESARRLTGSRSNNHWRSSIAIRGIRANLRRRDEEIVYKSKPMKCAGVLFSIGMLTGLFLPSAHGSIALTTLFSFAGTNGAAPYAALIQVLMGTSTAQPRRAALSAKERCSR